MRGGALSSLALCFFVSGFLRAGEVVAALPYPDGGELPRPAVPAASDDPEDLVGLAGELKRQRAALSAREAALDEREQLLHAIEARLRMRLDEMQAARKALARTAAQANDAAADDLRHLAAMYQQMKPRQAGQIFNEMAPEFAAGFLGELGADSAGQILASMDPQKAYAISVLLAGRNLDRAGRNGRGAAPRPLADATSQETPRAGSPDGSQSGAGPAVPGAASDLDPAAEASGRASASDGLNASAASDPIQGSSTQLP